MGRPSTFTQAIADEICERLRSGEPLAEICRGDGMPHPTTFRRWCDSTHSLDDEPLAIAYARAREDGFDAIAADALRIADTPEVGETESDEPLIVEGEEVGRITKVRREDLLGHRKLRVETRLKLLAKWDPKRYGDLIKLSGADGEGPVSTVNLSAEMSPAQAAEAYAKLLG